MVPLILGNPDICISVSHGVSHHNACVDHNRDPHTLHIHPLGFFGVPHLLKSSEPITLNGVRIAYKDG